MLLFFDTETSGLPKNWTAPASDLDNWPRLVQLAWILCDQDGAEVASQEHLIQPAGFRISAQASKVHGISTQQALDKGVPLGPVLVEFSDAVESADTFVGHNIAFDKNIVAAELLRAKLPDEVSRKPHVCTMRQTAGYCRLSGKGRGYKWPTLTELHQTLFGEPFAGAHGALSDTHACRKCFLRLREQGVFD